MTNKIKITDVNCTSGQNIIKIENAVEIRIEAIEETEYIATSGNGKIPAGNAHTYRASINGVLNQDLTFLRGICKIYQTTIQNG